MPSTGLFTKKKNVVRNSFAEFDCYSIHRNYLTRAVKIINLQLVV